MSENLFKAALAGGKPQIGLWLALADPYSAELCAGAGFDWLAVDGEHAPNDLRSTLSCLQAIAPYPSHAVVRPPVGNDVVIKQLLDIGAQTLLIPMVDTPEQARALVAATRYPPLGVRGVGAALARASRFGRDAGYLGEANDGVCLLLQVESVAGLEALEAIASVAGVDGVFIGPADLAASMGHLGLPGHPEVQDAIRDAARRIRATGRAAGILSTDEAQARTYLSWGYNFVAVGTDVTLLSRSTAALAAAFRS
ncbi:4-hydroxy-2-oxoheptanedioate aldolase [Deinococcus deserti]|uniref:Putative 2-dehydro-3-deoxyglucarate aldolase n=1 Tax=Deinococcus deserti (strain DSM 17065 / CIP 109153 / LMG 22923 / VCD115) TaxID=546414 RepID=C1D2L8_DEIDV|nr:4-hydroxy-2-oxoheptanedioate aldolase [Deinococcus deserti]ACO47657.1 putative 2-dehydro-3-deoxyglucarate aldolase [Deinococcus deserti VCD115]